MPHKTKVWIATVTYSSELGNLDVDYGVNDLEDLHAVIKQGTGYGVILSILVERNPAMIIDIPTIERQQRETATYEKSVSNRLVPSSSALGPELGGLESLGG